MPASERDLADAARVLGVGGRRADAHVTSAAERHACIGRPLEGLAASAPERRERIVALPVTAERAPAPPLPAHALAHALDMLNEGVLLLRGGETSYRNATAARLLAIEGDTLVREVRLLARAAERSGSGTTIEVVSAVARYELRAVPLAGTADDVRPAVLVVIEHASPALPSSAALCRGFGLTAREASVALLVTQGLHNDDVAHALGIRASTARHYTESVFAKFAVHSRAALAAAVLGAAQRRD